MNILKSLFYFTIGIFFWQQGMFVGYLPKSLDIEKMVSSGRLVSIKSYAMYPSSFLTILPAP